MINLRMAAFFTFAMASMVGCTTETTEPSEVSGIGSTTQASTVVGARRICCTNIPSWGSVIYHQENAGSSESSAWVTYSSNATPGVQCPYANNTCAPVRPAFDVPIPTDPGFDPSPRPLVPLLPTPPDP